MKYCLRYIIILPVIVSAVLTSFLFHGLFVTNSPYKNKIIPFACFILFLWIAASIKVLWLPSKTKSYYYTSEPKQPLFINIVFIILALIISVYFALTIWGIGYLSLSPIARINNGIQHQDTLYHSAIAESFSRSFIPSALINDETYLHYHTFSHFLINIFARMLSIPAFIAYNYIFPIVFLPLYIFAQMLAIFSAKKIFAGSATVLNIIDLLAIASFNMGIISNNILGKYAISKASYIASESYLIGNTLAFLFYSVLLLNIYRKPKKKNKVILFLIGIPSMIFLVSWAKISIGMLFTLSILYYFFRMKIKSIKYWCFNFYYGLVYLVCIKLFNNGAGVYSNIKDAFRLFAFSDYCSGSLGIAGHYLLLSVMSILFIIFELKYYRYNLTDIKSRKTIWVEEILIISLFAFLPGALLVINGGSAGYFSYFVETPAMIMLCGHDYINKAINRLRKDKAVFLLPAVLWCAIIGINACFNMIQKKKLITADRGSGFYDEMMEIREMAGDTPELYTFYLDSDAKAVDIFSDSLSNLYVYPALTRIGVINASYCWDDGKYYTFTDKNVGAYGLKDVRNGKLSFNEALKKAREMGKEKIIHVTKEGYEIIECN